MTRPEKPIDWAKVDHLLMAGCKGTEIAPHFDMHVNTFYDKVFEKHNIGFTEYSLIKRSQGDSLLKVKQFEKAMKSDNTMLIWLGKNRLEQKEHEDKSYTTPNDAALNSLIADVKSLLPKKEPENAVEQQASPELSGSDMPILDMDRGGSIGQDLCINPEADRPD